MKTKILIDSKIPYIKGVLEPYFEVEYHVGASITHEIAKSAGALMVRTRTECNKNLLENSQVEIVATATIGFDHIDLNYCKENNIEVATSAGCNGSAVVQYVFTALNGVGIAPPATLLVVGCGNVGSQLASKAQKLGFKTICTDAPLKESGKLSNFTLEEIEKALPLADVVSLHVPLTVKGNHKTANLVDEKFIAKMKKGAILINSSRGGVIDEEAVIKGLRSGQLGHAIIDVWQNEPQINRALLEMATYATTHIAGYSRKGKENGTMMAVHAIAEHFNIEPLKNWTIKSSHPELRELKWESITETMKYFFDIERESNFLKENPELFEQTRSDYSFREECF